MDSRATCPPITYTVGNWVNPKFAIKVLTKDTFDQLYACRRSPIVSKSVTGMIDPAEYDLEDVIKHPYLTPVSALAKLIEGTRLFRTMRSGITTPPPQTSEEDKEWMYDAGRVRDVAVAYGIYHPYITVTYYEDLLWHLSPLLLDSLLMRAGFPIDAARRRLLGGKRMSAEEKIKTLLTLDDIENNLPDSDAVKLMLEARNKGVIFDWKEKVIEMDIGD